VVGILSFWGSVALAFLKFLLNQALGCLEKVLAAQKYKGVIAAIARAVEKKFLIEYVWFEHLRFGAIANWVRAGKFLEILSSKDF
jgi:hypothetical protein